MPCKKEDGIMDMDTFSPAETHAAGRRAAQKLEPGAVVCLAGDLGAGKTVFAQGIAEGLGIGEPVCSPTFTLIQEYKGGRLPLYHFDVYRIDGLWDMDDLGYEEYFYGDGVCLVEWGSLIEELLPENTIYVNIAKDNSKGFDYRRISIRGLELD